MLKYCQSVFVCEEIGNILVIIYSTFNFGSIYIRIVYV